LKHSSSRADQDAGIAKEEMRASSLTEMIGAPELEGTILLRRLQGSLLDPSSPPYIHPRSLLLVVVQSERAGAALCPAPGTYIYHRQSIFRHNP